jgi:arabinogalactan oligomer/maltooligosaccharide transport system substrate-binding protein
MKKYFLIIGMTLVALAFAACRPYEGTSGTPGGIQGETIDFYGVPLTTEPVSLLVWMDDEDWATELIHAFREIHPDVGFRFQQIGNVDSRMLAMQDGPAGIGPDVWVQPHDTVSLAIRDRIIEPVPPLLQEKWERELIESAVRTLSFEGRMYGVPFQTENIALFYNRDLWGPTPPQTFEEIFEFARTWNNPATHQWTMTFYAGNPYRNIIWLTAAGMQLFGPNNDDFTRPGFDTPEAARGLEIFLSMRALYDVPMADTGLGSEENFLMGNSPLTISGPWAIGTALANGVDFGIARIPTIGGQQPIAFSGLMAAHASSFSSPVNRGWAYAFLDFKVSLEGAAILYDHRNIATTRRDYYLVPGLRDDPFLMGIAAQAAYTFPMPTIPQISQMWTPLGELFEFSWDGDLSIPEVQAHAMNTYRTLLEMVGFDVDF